MLERLVMHHVYGMAGEKHHPTFDNLLLSFSSLPRSNIVFSTLCEKGSRAIGSIIGPTIGGQLAQPSIFHPSWFSSTGFFARYERADAQPTLGDTIPCTRIIFIRPVTGSHILYLGVTVAIRAPEFETECSLRGDFRLRGNGGRRQNFTKLTR